MRAKENPASIHHQDFFRNAELLREEFSRLLSGSTIRASQVSILPSVSYGMATIAKNLRLKRTARIVTAGGQFPSNVYAWQSTGSKVVSVQPPEFNAERGKLWNERMLDAIRPGTALVALGHVYWADGTRFDLEAIAREARRVGALVVVDGTQSIGAMPFDFKSIKPDAVVCAGYKWLMGPYSIGVAWYGDYFKDGKPLEENWITRASSEDFRTLTDYMDSYQPGMVRYDMGERSNFTLLPMLLESLRMVNRWKPERVQAYCQAISREALHKLRESGWWVEDEAHRGHHLFGILPPAGKKAVDWQPVLTKHRISVSFRGEVIRVSPHVYNSSRELNLLARHLTA